MKEYTIISDNNKIKNVNSCSSFAENSYTKNIFLGDEKEIILCVGQVQSGKTRKILNVIKYAKTLNYKYIIIFGGTNNTLLNQTFNRLQEEFSNNKNIIISNKRSLNCYDSDDKMYIFNFNKDSYNSKEIFHFINKKTLNDKKVLIIDDESDFGTTNFSEDAKNSIYSSILSLYKRIYKGKLLLVTATPFANLTNSNKNELSPSRMVVWHPEEGYTGLEFFNKLSETCYIEDSGSKDDSSSWENSIRKSFLSFLDSLFRIYRIEKNNTKGDFLINIDYRNDIHHDILNITEKVIKEVDDDFEYVKHIIGKDIEDRKESDLNEFWNYFCNSKNLKLFILNKNQKELFKDTSIRIIIGGFMMSRGVTFENLLTELILNNPKNQIQVDTLLQKCRWFGYRKNHQYIRVYMSKEFKDALVIAERYINLFKNKTSIDKIKKIIEEYDNENKLVRGTSEV